MEQAMLTFLDQGLLGASVVALTIAVLYMYRENKALYKEILSDAKESTKASIEASHAVAKSIDELSDKIEIVQRRR